MRRRWAGAAVLALGCAVAGSAQVVVLDGKSTIGSDSKNGHAIRIVSQNSGGARVSIRTQPAVALVCDEKTPKTTCYAWVKPGGTITVSLRRPPSPRIVPGQGAAPKPDQWAFDCVGTRGPDCTVTMTQARTVMVDWGQ
jgi:hypothetical protein